MKRLFSAQDSPKGLSYWGYIGIMEITWKLLLGYVAWSFVFYLAKGLLL